MVLVSDDLFNDLAEFLLVFLLHLPVFIYIVIYNKIYVDKICFLIVKSIHFDLVDVLLDHCIPLVKWRTSWLFGIEVGENLSCLPLFHLLFYIGEAFFGFIYSLSVLKDL